MNNRYLLSLILMLFWVSFSGNAQTQEKNKVEATVHNLVQAIIEADRSKLENLSSSKLQYGHSTGVIQDRAAFIEEIVSKNPLNYQNIELKDQTIELTGNVAIVRHLYIATAENQANEKVDIRIGNMMVLIKENKDWKLLARQAYKL